MPISQAFFRRSNAFLLAVGIAVLVIIVSTSLWLTTASERYFGEVTAARAVRSASADLLSRVQDAETGQRGYLLTRDESYLEPYTAAVANLPDNKARLERAVANLREVEPNVKRLSSRLDQKMAELASTLAPARNGDFEAALAVVGTGAGKQLMDEIRTDLAAILNKSEAELREAMDAQITASTRLRWTTIIGAILILAMAGAASWTIISYTRELVATRREVETLNVGLEERVRQRTDALVKANEEVQRFAYIVTHDLRAPLVNIMGFTSELEAMFKPIDTYVAAGPAASPEQKAEAEEALRVDVTEAIGFIRSSTRKMDGLINAILKISREGRRELRIESVDLAALIEARSRSGPSPGERRGRRRNHDRLPGAAHRQRPPFARPDHGQSPRQRHQVSGAGAADPDIRPDASASAAAGSESRSRTMAAASRPATASAFSSCSAGPASRTPPARESASPMCGRWCAIWAATSACAQNLERARPLRSPCRRTLRPTNGVPKRDQRKTRIDRHDRG